MPLLTTIQAEGQGGTRGAEGVRSGCKWMEDVQEDGEGEPGERSRELQSTTAPAAAWTWTWTQYLHDLQPQTGWLLCLAPVVALWLFDQVVALMHSSSWRLLLVCALWMLAGGCVLALKLCPRPEQAQRVRRNQRQEEEEEEEEEEEVPQRRIQQQEVPQGRIQEEEEVSQRRIQEEEVVTVVENTNVQHSWMQLPQSSDVHLPLAVALAKSLLLCVLHEPLPDPSVPHVQALLSRLESVFLTLETAGAGAEATQDHQDSVLTDKVKLICKYLQQRMRSLRAVVQVQGDFEASVKDMLEGLGGLWAQLEQLHTGVTLTKEGGQGGHGDLASAETDAESLFSVVGDYRNRLQCCQTHLKEVTELLQELAWSHTHISNSSSGGGGGGECVWPELLLQSNIEQFDKVQESFLSLEQQTSTFQAHLEGLRKENREGGHAKALAAANGARSCSAESPQTSSRLHDGRGSDASLERRDSASLSASSADPDSDTETRRSLCERSGTQLSSPFGRLRKPGKKK